MKAFTTSLLLLWFINGSHAQSPFNIAQTGNGKQPVILISGLACKNEVWNETAQALAKESTVYALDFYREDEGSCITLEQIAAQVVDWIKTKKIKEPIIIGHSLGGAVALNVASKIPGQIKKLVIIDSYPALAAFSNPSFTGNPENDCSPFVQQFTAMNSEQYKNFQNMNLSKMTMNAAKKEILLQWNLNYNRKNYALLLCNYMNTDYRENIKSIGCPVLLLASSSMQPMQEKISAQYSGLKNLKIQYSDAGLHFLMWDDFDWYMNQINKFLD